MLSRFVSNLALGVLGAVLMTMSLTVRPSVLGWLALGVGCAAVLVTLAAFACHGRGPFQRILDVAIALLGGWTIVSARAFAGHSLRWLSFSHAVAVLCLAVPGLIGHEVLMQRALRRPPRRAASDGRRPADAGRPAGERERERVGAW